MLSQPLKTLIRTTPAHIKKLEKMGIYTGRDLLEYFPRTLEDAGIRTKFSEIILDEKNTLGGELHSFQVQKTKYGKRIAKAILSLKDGDIEVIWFAIPYNMRNFEGSKYAFLVGKVKRNYGKIQISSPEIHFEQNIHVGSIRPVYPESPPITSKWLREKISGLLSLVQDFEEILPNEILTSENLISKPQAIKKIHFPTSVESWYEAKRRLGFEEIFEIQLRVLQMKALRQQNEKSHFKVPFQPEFVKKDLERLPFTLTNHQKKALVEILKDFEKDRPMHRLLQGDVGSGKTIVAFLAAMQIIRAGYQVVILAPTEILAKQHFESAMRFLGEDEVFTNLNPLNPPCQGDLMELINTDLPFIPYKQELTPLAQEMRKNPTKGEHAMWKILQTELFDDLKFTRQKPLLGFIADFYCAELKIVIEIDGSIHEAQKEYDFVRDEALKEYGIIVLRFENNEVINLPELVKSKLKKFLESPLTRGSRGLNKKEVPTIKLLTGSTSAKEKKQIKSDLKIGQIKLLIGTHAVLTEDTIFKNLGFAVIDEQHRFGVKQRTVLSENFSHVLSMTATPIPRSLALTIYGDQDLSIITEKPAGRKPIITRVIGDDATRRKCEYFIADQINKGRQIFWVCPLVDESDKIEARNVKAEYERISQVVFPQKKVGFLHGKMKPKEKESIMNEFKNHKFDILVSTSVIEVGVDIPNATVMVIENAERFGLAQLHQFRGRIGRNDMQSYCFLMVDKKEDKQKERLRAMEKSNDGFYLSEVDLQLRGSGEIYGLKQSGLPDLKCADLNDIEAMKKARSWAQKILATDIYLSHYPKLQKQIERLNTYLS